MSDDGRKCPDCGRIFYTPTGLNECPLCGVALDG
jgi:uncharacterized OB-fold protein